MTAHIQTLHQHKDDAECWQRILMLSHAMQENARQGTWEEVIKSESERQGLIENYFTRQATVEDAQNLASDIQTILDIDREIMDLGKRNKDELFSEINNLQKGRKATRLYSANHS